MCEAHTWTQQTSGYFKNVLSEAAAQGGSCLLPKSKQACSSSLWPTPWRGFTKCANKLQRGEQKKRMRQGPSVSPGQNLFWNFEAQVARTKAVAGRGRRDGSPTGPKEASSKTYIYIGISSGIRWGSTGYPAIASRFSEMQSPIASGSPRISSRISLIYNTIRDGTGSLPDSYI